MFRKAMLALPVVLGLAVPAHADIPAAELIICFTPQSDCEGLVEIAIELAQTKIHVQAYGFTSARILGALLAAKKRGVDVHVILDKSNMRDRYTGATTMLNAGIPVWIDAPAGIAHNKVMVIDDYWTVGGSANFTRSAATRNVENVTITASAWVAGKYMGNWYTRQGMSERLERKQ
jgi:phosphatidylserine/phosphatidylglycerophosphate/cardiolipin synthase-like enzyme